MVVPLVELIIWVLLFWLTYVEIICRQKITSEAKKYTYPAGLEVSYLLCTYDRRKNEEDALAKRENFRKKSIIWLVY